MSIITSVRTTCRVCGGKLNPVYSFGDFYLSGFGEVGHAEHKAPLELMECSNEDCGLIQLKHTVSPDVLYSQGYWYKSGINEMIKKDLYFIVHEAYGIRNFHSAGDKFLDIGANDGTLLSFLPEGIIRFGIEPALNFREELKKYCHSFIGKFWEHVTDGDIVECLKKAKENMGGNSWYSSQTDDKLLFQYITAIGMFYDSENPNAFIANVKKYLAEDGLFIAQMMTLKQMVENNDIGNICHEHLEYYSYKSLKKLFEQNGLEIFRVEENDINGGSYRLFARHYKKGSIEHKEQNVIIKAFVNRVVKNKKKTVAFIKKMVAKGKRIYGYGASTKGNFLLQDYKMTPNLILGIADKNPDKWGKYTAGTNIPIVSEDTARAKADYFWILPWGFTDYFIEREKEWRQKGGKFIVSTPSFKII